MKIRSRLLFLIICVAVLNNCSKIDIKNKSINLYEQKFKYSDNINLKYNKDVVEYNFRFNSPLVKRIKLPIESVVINGTSALGFIEALDQRDKISGIVNSNYIFDKDINDNIKNGNIKKIGKQVTIDIESVLKINPDVFISYSDPNMIKIHEKLEQLGVSVILIDDFKETTPLAKSEWIKFFGVIFGEKDKANNYFEKVEENYNSIKNKCQLIKVRPRILVDIMYGDVWYLPGKDSFLTNIINDAGGVYVFNDDENETLNYSFERVYRKANNANIWINVSNLTTLNQLKAKNLNYSLFDAFKFKNVYSLTGNLNNEANNYFEMGVVRPDLILNDLYNIFHSQSNSDQLKFYKRLK